MIISKLYSGVRPRFKVFAKEKSGLHRRLFSYYHSIKLTNCQAHWLFLCVFHGLDLSRAHLHEVSFIACSLSILASAYGIWTRFICCIFLYNISLKQLYIINNIYVYNIQYLIEVNITSSKSLSFCLLYLLFDYLFSTIDLFFFIMVENVKFNRLNLYSIAKIINYILSCKYFLTFFMKINQF